jgi:hypothetical protein
VIDPLAVQILAGAFAPGDRVVADVATAPGEDGIAFRREGATESGAAA